MPKQTARAGFWLEVTSKVLCSGFQPRMVIPEAIMEAALAQLIDRHPRFGLLEKADGLLVCKSTSS